MESFDIAIVGSGPSGISTALSLQKLDPALAARTVILEKDRHPRHKLCGGGVTFTAKPALEHIGLPMDAFDIPQVQIDTVKVQFEARTVAVHFKDAFRIIRRDAFDQKLALHARERGIEIREETPVRKIEPTEGGVLITTASGPLHARVVIGADGSRGVVRRHMDLDDPSRVSRLMEILTPETPDAPEYTESFATFDFTPLKEGNQGYYWDFPSLIDGQHFMNRGLFDSRVRAGKQRADMKTVLGGELDRRGIELAKYDLKGCPERWFDKRGRYSNPNIVLVGDAAGVEPFLGEGIAFALMYGPSVAPIIKDAFDRQDFSFKDYDRKLLRSHVGRTLRFRTFMARFFYSQHPRVVRWTLPLTPLAAAFIAWRSKGR
jgi:flavin-dependent dehydrogenase